MVGFIDISELSRLTFDVIERTPASVTLTEIIRKLSQLIVPLWRNCTKGRELETRPQQYITI